VLGPKHGKSYGEVKRVVSESEELLWLLRSGQIPLIPTRLKRLKEVYSRAEKSINTLISDREAVSYDAPWMPIVDAVMVSTEKLVKNMMRETRYETMVAAVKTLVDEGMPDRALGPSRELVVALLLARKFGPGDYPIAGPEWSQVEELLRLCSVTEQYCGGLGVDRRDVGDYERARQYRNMLMHGRLSREEKAVIKVYSNGDIEVTGSRGEKLNPISLDRVREVAKSIARLLERVRPSPATRGK